MKRLLFSCFAMLLVVLPALTRPIYAEEPIKIGFVYVFSDRLAHYGYGAKQGAELAIEQINNSGGLLGRRLEGLYADDKLKPDVGVQVVTRLITQDKVDAVMGIVSSSVADAVAPIADKYSTPLIITLAVTPDVTGPKCNPFTFRISMNGPQNIMSAAQIAAETKADYWTTVGPDYLFGYQSWEYFQRYLRRKRPDVKFTKEADAIYAPMSTTNFTPYIDRLLRSPATGVLVSLYGGNLVDFVRQGTEKGLFDGKRTFVMNLAYSADVMYGLGLDMPKGLWLGGLYWFQANNSQINRDFVEAYSKKHILFPDYNAHGAYAGVMAYAAAVRKAGTTDKVAVAQALEGMMIQLPAGDITIRAGDHQAITDAAWGMTADFDPQTRSRALKPLRIFKGEEITPPVEDTGCRMRPIQ